jgi:hypothetical protein
MKPALIAMAALAAAVSLSACAITPAEMARPAALAGASAVPISGIGGGQKGSFTVAGNSGAFSRTATHLSVFDIFNARDGGASFTLQGADFRDGLQVACTMRERSITLDIVEFKPAPMALGCDVKAAGRSAPAMLEIQESAPDLTNRQQRRGAVMIDGARLDIRSVHEIAGSLLPTSQPMGYVFERNGIAIGGVDLNNGPMMLQGAAASEADRKAVLLAAVALSVFWDPAALDA